MVRGGSKKSKKGSWWGYLLKSHILLYPKTTPKSKQNQSFIHNFTILEFKPTAQKVTQSYISCVIIR